MTDKGEEETEAESEEDEEEGIEENTEAITETESEPDLSVFSKEQLEEIEEVFNLFDTKKTDTMLCTDLGMALRVLGYNPTEAQIQERINKADKEETGSITHMEFIKTVAKVMKTPTYRDEIREAFLLIDREGDGFVTTADLRQLVTTMGEALTDEEVNEMIREADRTGEGRVNYEEYIDVMISK